MAIYLGGQKYSCNIGNELRRIMVDLSMSGPAPVNHITAATVDNKILTTKDGLYLKVEEE